MPKRQEKSISRNELWADGVQLDSRSRLISVPSKEEMQSPFDSYNLLGCHSPPHLEDLLYYCYNQKSIG